VWYKVVELGTRTEVVAADALMLRYVEGCEACSTGKGDYFKRAVVGRRRWRGQVCGVQSSGQVRSGQVLKGIEMGVVGIRGQF
jgi:hypothetical protein